MVERLQVIQALGGKCEQCGFADVRALELHHRWGDGHKDRKFYSGRAYYRLLLRDLYTGRIALLCANCHAITTHDNFERGRKKFNLDELSDGELMQLDMEAHDDD